LARFAALDLSVLSFVQLHCYTVWGISSICLTALLFSNEVMIKSLYPSRLLKLLLSSNACILFIAVRYMSIVALVTGTVGFFATGFSPLACDRYHLVAPLTKRTSCTLFGSFKSHQSSSVRRAHFPNYRFRSHLRHFSEVTLGILDAVRPVHSMFGSGTHRKRV
jgi:hypothetical protein